MKHNEEHHNPEPWKEGGEVFSGGTGALLGVLLLDKDGKRIGVLPIKAARRIVACVNACRGMPTEELEDPEIVTVCIHSAHPAFIDLCRQAYWAISAQQKYLDPCKRCPNELNREALQSLHEAFQMIGARCESPS